MKEGKEEYPSNGFLGLSKGAPGSGDGRVAHVDVALHGQGQREPNWGRVENLWHILQHCHVRVASLFGMKRFIIAQCVYVKVPG